MKQVKRFFKVFLEGMKDFFDNGWVWIFVLVSAIFNLKRGVFKMIWSSAQFLLGLLFIGGIRNVWRTRRRQRKARKS